MMVAIEDTIDIDRVYKYLQCVEAGAINVFIGTVRNGTKGKQVKKLVFEAYEKMALKQMKRIAEDALSKWTLHKLVMIHSTGEKMPGEAVVAVGVSSAHRDVSFQACRFLIDELKGSVPIWKKEFYNDGSIWVNAHP